MYVWHSHLSDTKVSFQSPPLHKTEFSSPEKWGQTFGLGHKRYFSGQARVCHIQGQVAQNAPKHLCLLHGLWTGESTSIPGNAVRTFCLTEDSQTSHQVYLSPEFKIQTFLPTVAAIIGNALYNLVWGFLEIFPDLQGPQNEDCQVKMQFTTSCVTLNYLSSSEVLFGYRWLVLERHWELNISLVPE